MRAITVIFCVFFSIVQTNAAVTLPRVFGDNMVLQRDRPIPVFGTAEPGEKVTVAFAAQEKSTQSDQSGAWKVVLDPLPANKTPQTLRVSGMNKVTIENVLIGEVWLCSGQSNMEWPVDKSLNFEQEKASADFPEIRHFKIPRTSSAFAQPNVKGEWQVCTPSKVGGFSAVGYFFARDLFQKLDVPIGLVNSTWGGTSIEVWMSPESVTATPVLTELNEKLFAQSSLSPEGKKRYEEYVAKLKRWTSETELALSKNEVVTEPPTVPWPAWDNPQPTQLYKGMIHPLAPFAIRGVLWYQGESNGFEDGIYKTKLEALIQGWRQKWNQGDFPFYIVQIANYIKPNEEGKTWARVRESQLKALEIPNTGLAVTVDLGDSTDIHPKNKQDVGSRLALWALAGPYGKDIEPSGPLYQSHRIEGDKIHIAFSHAKNGLMLGKKEGLSPVEPDTAGKLKWIEIAAEDRVFRPADATIEGSELVVSHPQISSPLAVRYAFIQDPAAANLYNKEGLPASPFRSDIW